MFTDASLFTDASPPARTSEGERGENPRGTNPKKSDAAEAEATRGTPGRQCEGSYYW